MQTARRILHLEDDDADALMVRKKLEQAGSPANITRVESRDEFENAIKTGGYELILSDYQLPGYDGLSALLFAVANAPEVPFLFVSGTIGEDFAADALKAGATDYVVKTRLSRLSPAIHRALKEVEDRTERKLAMEREKLANQRLEEAIVRANRLAVLAEAASKAKSEFLAMMSHELRTPLNGIIGVLSLVNQSSLTEEQRQNVSVVEASADSLLTIINEILDFSTIEAGKLAFHPTACNLREIAKLVVDLLAPKAREKGLGLQFDYSESVPAQFVTDPCRFRQVLMNLIGNAIKFTEQGQIQVRVACEEVTAESALITVAVQDTGIGITEEQMGKLFEAFSQGDSSTTRRYGGTGLGLSISQRLVRMLGGEIEVKSAAGEGATFAFALRLNRAQPAQAAIQPVATAADELSNQRINLRVLVAEDNPTNQFVTTRMLKKLQCEVDVANDGREAVEMARKVPYDLILMDCQMPVMDGFAATEVLCREMPGACRPPIVAVTANAMEGDREKCLAAGMDDYIAKPVKFADLQHLLQYSLTPKRA